MNGDDTENYVNEQFRAGEKSIQFFMFQYNRPFTHAYFLSSCVNDDDGDGMRVFDFNRW